MQASEGGILAVEIVLAVAASAGMQLIASEVSLAAYEGKAVSAWKGAAAYMRIAVFGWLQQPQHLLQDMHAVAAAVAVVRTELVAAVAGILLRLLMLPMGHSCWIQGPIQQAHFQ